ncbi:hypothetical protein K502DRAFT_366697 [Neoconidiobolus thromboides FSU 785]|nr:hypothetical protein K502DRAFT_366697 [Neoconidiobolus thromboides FSU 785]
MKLYTSTKILFLLNFIAPFYTSLTQQQFNVELYHEINRVRQQRGLSAIPYSNELTKVADTHVKDLNANRKQESRSNCNLHSWYLPGNSCCYYEDHKDPECMWDKPKQLSRYTEDGFEIAFSSDGKEELTKELAKSIINTFLNSPPHRQVILSEGTWSSEPWLALGTANFNFYTVAWFGRAKDPNSSLPDVSGGNKPTSPSSKPTVPTMPTSITQLPTKTSIPSVSAVKPTVPTSLPTVKPTVPTSATTAKPTIPVPRTITSGSASAPQPSGNAPTSDPHYDIGKSTTASSPNPSTPVGPQTPSKTSNPSSTTPSHRLKCKNKL